MSERVRLYPHRTKYVIVALGCAIMSAGSVWVIVDGNWFGYVGTAFFGLGVVVSLITLWPGSSFLELNDSGFIIRNLFRDSGMPWSDVELFEARRVGVRKMVAVKFAPQYTGFPKGRAMAQALSGAEGGLPDTYGKSAEDLARLLNEYVQKQRQSATAGDAT